MIHNRMAFLKQVRKEICREQSYPPKGMSRQIDQFTRWMVKSMTSIIASLSGPAGSGASASRAILP